MSRVFKVDYIPDPDRGRPLWNAKIYVGIPNEDPTIPSNQIQLTGDIGFPVGQSIPVPQPVRTNKGGVTVYNNSPLDLNAPGQEYAIAIYDRNDNLIYNFPQVDGVVAMDTTSQEEITGLIVHPDVGIAAPGQTVDAGVTAFRAVLNGSSRLFTTDRPVVTSGILNSIVINQDYGTGTADVDGDIYQLRDYTTQTQEEITGVDYINVTQAQIDAGFDIFPLIGQGLRVAGVGLFVVPEFLTDGHTSLPNPSILDAVPSGPDVTVNGGTQVTLESASTPNQLGRVLSAPAVSNFKLLDRIKNEGFNLKYDGGAVDDEQVDSTSAFDLAWEALVDAGYKRQESLPGEESFFVQKGPQLIIPEGNFRYDGTGLNIGASDSFVFNVNGKSQLATKIYLPDGVYLFDFDNNPVYSYLGNITFNGGLGVCRYKSTARTVARTHTIENCAFSRYTQSAFQVNSIDLPNVRILSNIFDGDPDEPTIGVALSGLSAGSRIAGNIFYTNRYHIKLGIGDDGSEQNSVLPLDIADQNDFIRLGNRVGAAFDVWIVPNPNQAKNSARGVNILGSKFGQENLTSDDAHILIADESGGTYNGDRTHVTTQSSGFVSGLHTSDNNINSETTGVRVPFIKSFTPNVGNVHIEDSWDNGVPTRVLEFAGGITQEQVGNLARSNVLDISQYLPAQEGETPPLVPSNLKDIFKVIDPIGWLSGSSEKVTEYDTGQYLNFVSIFDGPTSGAPVADASKATIDNSYGGTDEAAEVTLNNSNGRIVFTANDANVEVGRQTWLDLELKKPASDAVQSVNVSILDAAGSVLWLRRQILIDQTERWQKVIIPFFPNAKEAFVVRVTSDEYSASTNKFQIGNVKIYRSEQPVNTGHNRVYDSNWSRQHLVMGVYHQWYDASGNLRHKAGAPTSDTDGVIISANPAV